jgi:ABC-2 type transport system permease protein
MRRILLMVRKDLLRQLRTPLAIATVLAFPLVFAALIAVAFGGAGDAAPRVRLLVEDRDGSFASGLLVGALTSDRAAEYFDVERVDAPGEAALEREDAAALLRIPAGFGADYLRGRPVALELVRNPAQGIFPEIAEQAMTVGVDVLAAGSRLLRDPLDRLAAATAGDGIDFSSEQAAALATSIHATLEASGALLFPPVITLETVELGGEPARSPRPTTASLFAYVLPGIGVWALFLAGELGMRDLVVEGSKGTLRRQICCPLRPWQIVIGKALYTAALAALSWLVLSAIGAVALRRAVSLPGYLSLSLALIVALTGYSATMYGALRTQRQAATLSSVLLLLFAFTGGSFFDVDLLPGVMRKLAPLSPFYWGTTGYRALIREGGGLADVAPNVAVLATVGGVLLALGCGLLHRRVRRGIAA